MKSVHRVAGGVATALMTLWMFTACATEDNDSTDTSEPGAVESNDASEASEGSDEAVSDMPEWGSPQVVDM